MSKASGILAIQPHVYPDDGPKVGCSFQLFGQILRSDVPLALLQEVEEEIQEPTGISTIHAPDMKLQGVLLSQNCGILYELPDISGMKSAIQRILDEGTKLTGLQVPDFVQKDHVV